jgi:cation diffusion facilitator CzcD-associated flavoprotein CzcO
MEQQTVDYLVIGAGPAGLQLGYFLDRAGRDYLILEAGGVPGASDLDQQATHWSRRSRAHVAVGLELPAEATIPSSGSPHIRIDTSRTPTTISVT